MCMLLCVGLGPATGAAGGTWRCRGARGDRGCGAAGFAPRIPGENKQKEPTKKIAHVDTEQEEGGYGGAAPGAPHLLSAEEIRDTKLPSSC